jgi:hypothetical protein
MARISADYLFSTTMVFQLPISMMQNYGLTIGLTTGAAEVADTAKVDATAMTPVNCKYKTEELPKEKKKKKEIIA